MADQPKAKSVSLEDFIEIATQAALRAVDAHNVQVELNPQPLPPGRSQATQREGQHRPDYVIGIVLSPEKLAARNRTCTRSKSRKSDLHVNRQ